MYVPASSSDSPDFFFFFFLRIYLHLLLLLVLSFSGIYKPVECWKIEDQTPPAKRRHGSSVYTLKEMEEATCSFSDEKLLGKGGFGRVYKGNLRSGEVNTHSVN